MADIQPFRAIRYDLAHVGNLSQVVAPPYDVIDSELQTELYKAHPTNIIRLILNRTEPGDEPDDHYRRARDFLRNWTRQGVLKQDPQNAVYIYHQVFEHDGAEITRRGFIARVRLERFGEGHIYPHEQTHSGAKEDRLKLTRATQCNLSQVFSIYDDRQNEIQELLENGIEDQTPSQATDHLGVIHRLWTVTDSQVLAAAGGAFGPKALYIADGHHRYETALNYRDELEDNLPEDHPANYISMFCVSMADPGMIVLPTHRLWRGLKPTPSQQLAKALGESFDCRVVGKGLDLGTSLWNQLQVDDHQDQLAFYCAEDDTWILSRLTPEGAQRLADELPGHSETRRELGVTILHELAMPLLIGDDELATPRYVHSTEELKSAIETGDQAGRDATGQLGTQGRFELATLVMPATIEHVRKISENSERMPAKSTYFYPKLLSGLVINPLHR